MKNGLTIVLTLFAGLQLSANGRAPSVAPPIAIGFDRGLVTIHASSVSAAEILKQYGAVGNVEIQNLDVVPATAITIALDRVPEVTALDILTRYCGGYLATQRLDADQFHQSHFRRIVIFKEGARSTTIAPPPIATPPPPPPPIESNEPAPGEVRPRIGPDGKPMEDDQQGAPH